MAAPDPTLPGLATGSRPHPSPRPFAALLWLAHHVAPPGISVRLLRLWLRLRLWWRGWPLRRALAVGTLCDGPEEAAVLLAFLVTLLRLIHSRRCSMCWRRARMGGALHSDAPLASGCASGATDSRPRVNTKLPFPRRWDGRPGVPSTHRSLARPRQTRHQGTSDMVPMCCRPQPSPGNWDERGEQSSGTSSQKRRLVRRARTPKAIEAGGAY